MVVKRGKGKLRNALTLPDMYEEYISHFDESHPYHIPYSEYSKIVSDYMKYVSELIVVKSLTFKLPFRLGTLSIYKHKPIFSSVRKMAIDWPKTNKTGKAVYNFNEHSNGYSYRFKWDRNGSVDKHMVLYSFKPSRQNARLVATLVKERKNDYFELL
jgi:hypothetical protein